MHLILKKLFVALIFIKNCNGYANKFNSPNQARVSRAYDRFLWSQLESSGLVPVEINVQDTVTDLSSGMMQMWSNAQEWWQEIQANNANRPNKKPTTPKPIPEYLYEEEIPVVTTKLKKKLGQSKKNVKKKNQIMSTLKDNGVQEHKEDDAIDSSQHKPHKDKPMKGDSEHDKKPKKKKKKKSKKHNKYITKVIDYQNYYYFFLGLLGLWPQF